jgi:hypothetical protein
MPYPLNSASMFWSKVDRGSGEQSCWPWQGSLATGGYGRFSFQGKARRAHQVAYFLTHGRWPEPLCCHRCDNRACCNPAHLFQGTSSDNNRDMCAKGRNVRPIGERHGCAKLTEQDVRDIRANYALCRVTQGTLAARFGVRPCTISEIINRKSWGHLG